MATNIYTFPFFLTFLLFAEKPDVFTVSVGNLPAGADVIIKIIYVTELSVEGDDVSRRTEKKTTYNNGV